MLIPPTKRLVSWTVIGVLLLGIAATFGWRLIPSSPDLPEGVTVEAVEKTYPDLLNRMAQIAAAGGTVTALDIVNDNNLVAPTEILEAKVGRNNSYMAVGNKTFSWRQRVDVFAPVPRLGQPVIAKYWPPHQNLWVNSGSGKAPSRWYKAILMPTAVR